MNDKQWWMTDNGKLQTLGNECVEWQTIDNVELTIWMTHNGDDRQWGMTNDVTW